MAKNEPLNPTETQPLPQDEPREENVRRRRRRTSGSRLRRFRRRLVKNLPLRSVGITLLVVLVLAVTISAVLISDAANQLNASQQSFERVLNNFSANSGTELTLTDFERLQSGVKDLRNTLALTQSRLQLVSAGRPLNAELNVSLEALSIAEDLSVAADTLMTGLEPTLFFMVAGETEEAVSARISSSERIVELLELGRGQFLSARERLATAETRLTSLNLNDISPDLLVLVDQLGLFQDQLDEIASLLIDAPDLLTLAIGLEREQTYLVLASNNDEIRPSGGFIGTWGYLRVRNGRVTEYEYGPSTTESPNPPPEDFIDDYDIPHWWIQYRDPVYAVWDGSWYADFPTTADMAMAYYNAGENPYAPVDGVIAIDIDGFETILAGIGEVSVPGYPARWGLINAANFRERVYDIREFGISQNTGEREHKEFLADMYEEIFNQWQRLDQERSGQLLGSLLQAVQEKHIMLRFVDEDLNRAVEALGWAGRQVQPVNHDYLMVADANLGNKSNNSVIRQTTYDAVIQPDGSVRGRVSVQWDYPDAIAALDPAVNPEFHGPLDYWTLFQIFVPHRSAFLDQENVPYGLQHVHMPGRNLTNFTSRQVIEYDSGQRVQVAYETPPVVERTGDFSRYRLLIQKQPGMRQEGLNVQITLPPDAELITTSPEVAASYVLEQTILDFRLELVSDQWVEVIYR